MINCVHCHARKAWFTIIKDKFDGGYGPRILQLVLGCERGGKYKGTKKKLKCGCPFRLCVYFSEPKLWSFIVVSGLHNHKTKQKLESSILACV